MPTPILRSPERIRAALVAQRDGGSAASIEFRLTGEHGTLEVCPPMRGSDGVTRIYTRYGYTYERQPYGETHVLRLPVDGQVMCGTCERQESPQDRCPALRFYRTGLGQG